MHATLLLFALSTVAQLPSGGAFPPTSPDYPPPAQGPVFAPPAGGLPKMGEPTPAPAPISQPAPPLAQVEPARPEFGGTSTLAPADAPRGEGPFRGSERAVVPATAEQPLAASEAEAPADPKALLMHGMAERPAAPAGQSLPIAAAIQRHGDRPGQLQAVRAYWLAALAVIDRNHAMDEVELLRSLPLPAARHEQLTLKAALAAAAARMQEALLASGAARHDLAEAVLSPAGEPLPAPGDVPFVGKYRTNFETLFTERAAPPGLARINRTLPGFRGLIEARAEAVTAGGEALWAAMEAYSRGEISLGAVLGLFTELRQQRIAFLAAVRDYNLSIADYAFAIAGPELDSTAIVSMLIETEKSAPPRSILVPPGGAADPADSPPALSPTR